MKETNDALWLAFEALAKTYPDDGGVRMTADLARWLLEERQRLQLPAPPIIQKVLGTVTQVLDARAAGRKGSRRPIRGRPQPKRSGPAKR